ncbi:MAG TPA: TIM barrel protein, partial [Verrucomicrobiae bacterium]|jgi:sugar phosphate isomerase/epimerase
MIHPELSRRNFVARVSAAGALAAISPAVLPLAAATTEQRFKIIAFTKPFRTLNAAQSAELVADVGWDGVELPVRAKDGQITPEKVEDELPKFIEAFRARQREVSIITTDITGVSQATEKVLRTASRLGIKRYRLGSINYAKDKPIPDQLKEVGARLRELAALNKELGLQAGFQNHSGDSRVGAPIWDIWTMIKDLDPKTMGICFDIGHATIEGGLAWPIHFRMASPHLTAVFVKDFFWKKNAKDWKMEWCPLGEGMVHRDFFNRLKATNYTGPICQHHEYELGDKDQMRAHFKKDLATLRDWLGKV